ncbi:MAG: thioredoxin family protein [Pirellulales bacterium]|nr:thioredoxin family protein [Pirellulales bacterium]
MKLIQVLGPGCPKCEKLKHNAEEAVTQAGVKATVEKITDINAIVGFGVMATPALGPIFLAKMGLILPQAILPGATVVLPLVYGVGTAVPVLLVAGVLAYAFEAPPW